MFKFGKGRGKLPQTDEVTLLECFRNVKQGPSREVLEPSRKLLIDIIDQLDSECEELALDVQKNPQSLKLLQVARRERNDAKRELREVNRLLHARPLSVDEVQNELDQILALPQVIGSHACLPDLIAFTVEASIISTSRTYDLGTWQIYFGNFAGTIAGGNGDRHNYRVRRVGKINAAAPYNYADGTFCFDEVGATIDDYAARRNFIHAAQVAVACLCTVNDEDLSILCDEDIYPVILHEGSDPWPASSTR